MSFNLIVTPTFERDAKILSKKYKSLKDDLSVLLNLLEENPFQGKPLGNDCYKIRMAISSKGKGKSAGARIITHVKILAGEVFLLTIFDKTEKETISDKKLRELLKLI